MGRPRLESPPSCGTLLHGWWPWEVSSHFGEHLAALECGAYASCRTEPLASQAFMPEKWTPRSPRIFTGMSTAAVFVTGKTRNGPSVHQQVVVRPCDGTRPNSYNNGSLKVMALSERSQATKNAYRSIPFIEHSRKCEIMYAGKVAQWFPGDVGGQKVPHGSPRELLKDGGCVLCLDGSDGFMGVYLGQNSSNSVM